MARPQAGAELPVAIVGAGFSGTLLAINLLRNGMRVVVIERDEAQIAKGLAFGTRRPEHLLNVRASNMSAFPDDTGHFLRWMGFSDAEQANRFVPRLAYGHYLREQLLDALAAAPGRADVRQGEAVSASFAPDAVTLTLASGETVRCRGLVLALGNLPPSRLPQLADLPGDLHIRNPWQPGAIEGLGDDDHVVLLGSGLTTVDVVLALDAAGFRGRITALSRRGLKPHGHAESGPAVGAVARPAARGSQLVREVRARAAEIGWRAAIDELRPHTQDLWRGHDESAQRRLLRHLRPYWDIHRHRLAPPAAARIAALEEEGRLRFVAGKVTGAEASDGAARISWRARRSDRIETVTAQRIISCIGPEGDITRSHDPLLRDLIEQGRVRPDAHRLGLDVDAAGHVRDAGGEPQNQLFAAGPLTKGEGWEIVAVPDIRRQVWSLARYLANAHWVGGEGL